MAETVCERLGCKIIDSHAHIYPQKIAEKATKAIGDFYDIKMQIESGEPERLIENGKKAGISKFLVHSCATKKEQVHAINTFIKNEIEEHKEFIGFMTLSVDMQKKEIEDEISWAIKNKLKGIKLHPDFQKFDIDSLDAENIYQTIDEMKINFPILFHTGDDRYTFSAPDRLAKMCKKYPKLKFIGAHFGGYRCWNNVDVYKSLDNVFFDTSSSLMFIGSEKAKELIDKFSCEKFFFGTDFPMWNATEELERFDKIRITDKEKEKILSLNIENLLEIK